MKKFYNVLNNSNNKSKPEFTTTFFKFSVGLGNNHPSVIHAVKLRSWWHKKKTEKLINLTAVKSVEDSDEDDL
jgi:hypothetical protein